MTYYTQVKVIGLWEEKNINLQQILLVISEIKNSANKTDKKSPR